MRSDIFAWYTLFGTLGAALGTLTCGFVVAALQSSLAWPVVKAYRVVYVLYAILGLVKLALTLMLTTAVELEDPKTVYQEVATELDEEAFLSDDSEIEAETAAARHEKTSRISIPPQQARQSLRDRFTVLLPTISPLSRKIVGKLICLFAMDSFASGLASPSWLTYFFTTVHSLPTQALGTLFLVTNLLATVSNLLALPIARRLGPLRTMTFTHLPSALFLGVIPLPPATNSGTWLSMTFLALRACTQSMDQAPRQAFLGAVVLPAERTAVLGVVNIAKTLAQAGGIGSSGLLTDANLWVVMFSGAGLLKASYDLLMLWMFLGTKDRDNLDRG